MQAPKILPWIAKKSAISDELALSLWRRAAAEAEEMAGNSDSDDYYRLAIERLLDLCADEGDRVSNSVSFASHFGWMRRHQNRLVQLNMLAARNSYRLWLNSWNKALLVQEERTQVH